ncbi:DEAD/DEAH box helicase family protein [uncultured Pontibacter sp.]|uniref:type I restriction endonuclease subunit R n=1 Tax=uncultured Pontibacter sp. TaxID=453356 RepID=UPI00262AA533|nr:DEAD/DEAH box helicase family protein [uncultured Pontibacter sp.]
MATGTKELHLEEHIEQHLVTKYGYHELHTSLYDKELCLVPEEVIGFLEATQPKPLKALREHYGARADERIVTNISKNITKFGTLHVLREGVKDAGQKLRLTYFKPVSGMNKEHQELYQANYFSVIRQLQYSKFNSNSLDLVIFLNGLPLLTSELKNALTGQYLTDAIRQYREDRDPKEPLFAYKRCLVHFAVSTEKVAMATKLAGLKTFFLPFNQDVENPVNPNGFKTEYLWDDVWAPDSLLDLVQNFVNEQTDQEVYFNEKEGKLDIKKSEKLIFPRYHQRKAVYKLLNAVAHEGVGHRYLIKHSAGSGKSNTISWLAHRLSNFFQNQTDEKSLFDSVIVVTDRRVLNKQLIANIKQFEQVPGVIAAIDEKQPGAELKKAIEEGSRIIITTLQKFPVISDTIARHPDRRYAVIIDEAHSSQSGESARHLRKSLSLNEAEQEDQQEKELDDLVLDEIQSRGRQNNVSFFAFTATPKPKTIELFGTKVDGKLEPFDEYTMRQAIAEGFILDVLGNYTPFKRYYKLAKRSSSDDKEYETRKAVRLLTSYVDLQDHAIELKSRIMLEHFVSKTANEINGRARAMVVTRSRLHAVRYKCKFDALMQEMKLPYRALVAFSGTVHDAETGMDYTETSMNDLGGNISIPDALKLPQNRILIVANKYQTGFDEPLLHTMFVDKKLGGVNTVQTLSRLNRTTSGKGGTMVLDFVNDPEDIQADFQDYFDLNFMAEDNQTDPNTLYDLQTEISLQGVVTSVELEAYAEVFFRKGDNKQLLQPLLGTALKRFTDELEEDAQDKFRADARDFVRLYKFLSQIITFSDVELEKLYVFLNHLLKVLPLKGSDLPQEVLNEVQLDSYKIQQQGQQNITLVEEPAELYGQTRSGGGNGSDELRDLLSNIIKTLNDTYGLELTDDDKLDFEQIRNRLESDQELLGIFNPNNSRENIKDKFNDVLDQALLDFIDTKLDLYNKLSEDKANATLKRLWFNSLYDARIRGLGK